METTEINSTAVPHFQRQCSCEWRKHNDERIHSIKKEPTPSKWTNVTRDFSKACSRRSFSRPRNQAMKKKKTGGGGWKRAGVAEKISSFSPTAVLLQRRGPTSFHRRSTMWRSRRRSLKRAGASVFRDGVKLSSSLSFRRPINVDRPALR